MKARLSRRRRIVFASVTVLVSLVATIALLGIADEAVRRYYATTLGINRWGYRGPVVGPKEPNELRVVMAGGSTTFGYGVMPSESIPALLERRLRLHETGRRITVVNLGYPKEGAWSLRFTLVDYAYLQYDIAIVYAGYNDLRYSNVQAFRRDSPVFRLTGYLPLLPIVLREKARAIRYGGDLAEHFGREDPVFRPGLADKAVAGTLKAAGEVARALEHVLGPLSSGRPAAVSPAPLEGCSKVFAHYCDSLAGAIDVGLSTGARVLVVSEPYISNSHVAQQAELATMLRLRFAGNPRVAYVNLGETVSLRDPTLAWDGMHLTPSGNARIAESLAEPVLRLTSGAR